MEPGAAPAGGKPPPDLRRTGLPDVLRTALRRPDYAYLQRATIDHARLVSADLTYVNLTEADLTGTDLTSATLRRTDFTGADPTDVVFPEQCLKPRESAGEECTFPVSEFRGAVR